MLVSVQSPHTFVIREREDVGGRNVWAETVVKVGALVRRDGDQAVLTVRGGSTALPPLPPLPPLLAGTGEADGGIARTDSEEMPHTRTVWQGGRVVTEV